MMSATPAQFSYLLLCLVILWILSLVTSATIPSVAPVLLATEIQHKAVCQGHRLKIRCPNSSYGLDIRGGTYGRTLPGSVVCSYEGQESDLYYNCGENNVQDKLKDLCQNKKKCNFVVGTALFGDPCEGRAYLNINYRCVITKMKTDVISPTTNMILNISWSTVNTTVSPNGTDLQEIPLISKKTAERPGIMISMIMWIVYVKERWTSFKVVFLISIGASLFVLIVICITYLLLRRRSKKRKRHSTNNKQTHQKVNPSSALNGNAKKTTELDALSNTFPAPISSLPPPPDDMIYPSPSPDMINATRPPPPSAPRVSSLDDISKIGQERNPKNVELTRSLSMRSRPPDYKDIHFDKYSPKLPPIQCCPDINNILPSKESTMYMNPMYENGHVKEVTC